MENTFFSRIFKRAHDKIELFREDIYRKDGFIFKTHKFSKEELFELRSYKQIHSMVEKIADDVNNWEKEGKLSKLEIDEYNYEKDSLYEAFDSLEREIKSREPTLWEWIGGAFNEVIRVTLNILPIIAQKQLGFFGKLGKVLQIGNK